MRKLFIGLSAGTAMLLGTVSAFAAGIGFGVSGNFVDIDAKGSEKTNTAVGSETTNGAIRNSEWIGSYYLELTLGDNDGWAVGYEAIPGAADISEQAHQRTDTETSVTGTVLEVSNSRLFKADAEVEDFKVIYGEIPLGSLFYARAGMAEITVNTKETASGNGGSYGNATLDGTQWGVGAKGLYRDHIRWKVGYEVNDFDTLSLTSTGNSVSGETNTLTADLDTWAIKLGLGLQF